MLKAQKVSDTRVDITLSGQIDADEMRQGMTDLFDQSEGMKNGQMLYRLTDFKMPTWAAIGVEFQMMPKLFGLLGRFGKCALICDTSWIATAAEIKGAIIPGLEIKAFEVGQEAEAEAWLNGDRA